MFIIDGGCQSSVNITHHTAPDDSGEAVIEARIDSDGRAGVISDGMV